MIIFTDRKNAKMPLEKVVENCIKKYKPNAIYLREKDLSDEEYALLAQKIMPLCKQSDTAFYICEREEIAKSLGVKNLHISVKNISKIGTICEFCNISVSIHNVDEVKTAIHAGATNLVFGHIFETQCKQGLPPHGLWQLEEICRVSNVPVVAIGGINSQNCNKVLECGASDFAIMSSAMKSTF